MWPLCFSEPVLFETVETAAARLCMQMLHGAVSLAFASQVQAAVKQSWGNVLHAAHTADGKTEAKQTEGGLPFEF